MTSCIGGRSNKQLLQKDVVFFAAPLEDWPATAVQSSIQFSDFLRFNWLNGNDPGCLFWNSQALTMSHISSASASSSFKETWDELLSLSVALCKCGQKLNKCEETEENFQRVITHISLPHLVSRFFLLCFKKLHLIQPGGHWARASQNFRQQYGWLWLASGRAARTEE